jgi:transposase
MTKKTKNKYNHYTEDFRREAVRRSDLPGASAVEVARELGIHPGQIYNWRRQYKRLSDKQFNTVNGVDYSQEESEEIRKLKRQISDLKEENEFLKKATVRMRPRTSAKKSGEVRLHPLFNRKVFHSEDVRLAWCQPCWLLQVVEPWHV